VWGDAAPPRGGGPLGGPGGGRTDPGGLRTPGLGVMGGGVPRERRWPELASSPASGLPRTRHDFDHILARRAVAAGADLRTGHHVTGLVRDQASGRVIGVRASTPDGERTFHAPITIAADGVSGRLPLALGLSKRDDRPMGV